MFTLLLALTIYIATAQASDGADLRLFDYGSYNHLPESAETTREYIDPLPCPVKEDPLRLGVETTSRAALAMDWQTGETLMEKNADQPLPIASITKLMTALVILDQGVSLDSTVEVSAEDIRSGGIQYVLPGEVIAVGDLLHASLVASANSATITLSRSTGLSSEEFVGRMNSLAFDIGLTSASFVEPSGLNSDNRASARDVARLIRQVLQNEVLGEIVLKDEYSFDAVTGLHHRLYSTDELLDGWITETPLEFLGGKTGFLNEAGYCFAAAAADDDGNRVISVVLGAPSKQDRFDDVGAMIYWSFDAFDWPKSS